MKRVLAITAALLLSLGGLCACGREASSIRINLAADIGTLDPQLATDGDAVTIIMNCFEGLVRRTAQGETVPAGARSWELSPDGRRYTFALREDALWSDGEPVTARDYVFALERVLDCDYLSPYASAFSSLAGARERIELGALVSRLAELEAEAEPEQPDDHAQELPETPAVPTVGEPLAPDAEAETEPQESPEQLRAEIAQRKAELPALGVRASGDYTLIFSLETANSGFLGTLAGSAALPCREDFFRKSRGRYAHTREYFLSNGCFSLAYWKDGEYLKLTPNEHYYDRAEVVPPSVYFYTDGSDAEAGLFAGGTDYALLSYSGLEKAQSRKLTVFSRENQIWALVFRQSGGLLAQEDARGALALTADLAGYAAAGRVPERYTAVGSMIAPGAIVGTEPYSSFGLPAPEQPHDPAAALPLLREGLAQAGLTQAPALSLILPESSELVDLAGYLQRVWLDSLQLYINVYTLPEAQYRQRLRSGDYDIAFQLLSSSADGPEGTLAAFGSGNADNRCGYSSAEYDALLAEAAASGDAAEKARLYARADALLLEDAAALPVFSQNSYYAYGKNVTGIEALPDGTLIFKKALRRK